MQAGLSTKVAGRHPFRKGAQANGGPSLFSSITSRNHADCCVQVAQMEGQLGRLMHDNVALKAAAQAAAGLHEKELVARQHMQEALARLKAELCTIRASAPHSLRCARSTFACFVP